MRLRKVMQGRPRTYRVLALVDGREVVIGFFTIVGRGGEYSFYDGLNLLPDHAELWSTAMSAALASNGPGRYTYGWTWSLEPSRELDLRNLEQARVESVRNILVQGVDFAEWPDWQTYYRAISENVRRNHKKAAQLHPDLDIRSYHGTQAVRHVRELVAMRREMYRSKDVPFKQVRTIAGYLGRFLTCPEQATITFASSGDNNLAVQHTVEFGPTHYYLDGASARESGGAAWLLQLEMLQRLHAQWPQGKFLLGPTDLPLVDQSAQGLLRSRRSLRAAGWETSVVTFAWQQAT